MHVHYFNIFQQKSEESDYIPEILHSFSIDRLVSIYI